MDAGAGHNALQLASLDPKASSRPTFSPDPAAEKSEPAKKKGFSFWDFLDVINPLQHIPVVSTLYRAITGDTIRPEAKLMGGGLFGGPIGLALSAADVVVEEETGKDTGSHVMALFTGAPHDKAPPRTQVAALPILSDSQLQIIAQSMNGIEPSAAGRARGDDNDRAAAVAVRREEAYEAALRRMADILAHHQTLDRTRQRPTVEVQTLSPL